MYTFIESELRIYNRSEWSALPALAGTSPLVLPAIRVIISHTSTSQCGNAVIILINLTKIYYNIYQYIHSTNIPIK